MTPDSITVRCIGKEGRLFRIELAFAADKSSPRYSFSEIKPHARLIEWLENYRRRVPGPLFEWEDELLFATPFQLKVFQALQNIPWGSTLSYSEIAVQIGHPGAARAVGNACRDNPFPLLIPCHRVLPKGSTSNSGTVGGFAYGPQMKQLLLRFERGTLPGGIVQNPLPD